MKTNSKKKTHTHKHTQRKIPPDQKQNEKKRSKQTDLKGENAQLNSTNETKRKFYAKIERNDAE